MKTNRYIVIIPEIKNHLCTSETDFDEDQILIQYAVVVVFLKKDLLLGMI